MDRGLRRVAALFALALCTAAAGAATTSMQVDTATDHSTGTTYDGSLPADDPVDDLNAVGNAADCTLKQVGALDESWDVRFVDPHPGTVKTGDTLTSVVVTIHVTQDNGASAGVRFDVRLSPSRLLKTTQTPSGGGDHSPAVDITTEINSETDPAAALNDLYVNGENLAINKDAWWTYVIVDVAYSPNDPPITPATITVPGSPGSVSRRVAGITATYSDPNGDLQQAADWEIWSTSPANRVAFLLNDTIDPAAVDLAAMALENQLAGRASLDPGQDYYVRVLQQDARGTWSMSWSVSSTFTTLANQPPATPSITSPLANAGNVALQPVLQSSAYVDGDGDAHLSSDWRIYEDALTTVLAAQSVGNAAHKTSVGVTPAAFTFVGTHQGEDSLLPGRSYWVVVVHTDAQGDPSAPSTPRRFTTGEYPTDESWPYYGSGCAATGGAGRAPLAVAAVALAWALRARRSWR